MLVLKPNNLHGHVSIKCVSLALICTDKLPDQTWMLYRISSTVVGLKPEPTLMWFSLTVSPICIYAQVREQQRYIALQIRREVEQRRRHELRQLEAELREDWERRQREKLLTLQRLYQESLQLLGQGHRSAKENVSEQLLSSLSRTPLLRTDK